METLFLGLCRALDLDRSATLPLTLLMAQNETSVTGTVTLGVTRPISDTDRLAAWDTTIVGNTLTGSFIWTFNYPGATFFNGTQRPGTTATVTANFRQVNRQ